MAIVKRESENQTQASEKETQTSENDSDGRQYWEGEPPRPPTPPGLSEHNELQFALGQIALVIIILIMKFKGGR